MTRPGKNNKMVWPTLIIATALFVGLFGFMFARLGHGSDPAVGAARAGQAKVVTVRKVVTERKVIWKDAPAQSAPAQSAPAQSAPVQSAPVQSAPSVTYTAPAPAQTQSS